MEYIHLGIPSSSSKMSYDGPSTSAADARRIEAVRVRVEKLAKLVEAKNWEPTITLLLGHPSFGVDFMEQFLTGCLVGRIFVSERLGL